MSKVIVTGHGGYASAMQRNLGMLVGDVEGFYFVDFDEGDSLEILQNRLNLVLAQIADAQVLFACDLAGGSPFRTAAVICSAHPDWAVVAGINTAAYSEISFHLEMSAYELAELARDVTLQSILIYPPKE
ncbi:MAG: PTS system fructose subfamily transporter subunit IIA [Firmicutes bacterium]|nr:PTS system fructose subfamily transporter subunit IIA [Bacillota bacterium]